MSLKSQYHKNVGHIRAGHIFEGTTEPFLDEASLNKCPVGSPVREPAVKILVFLYITLFFIGLTASAVCLLLLSGPDESSQRAEGGRTWDGDLLRVPVASYEQNGSSETLQQHSHHGCRDGVHIILYTRIQVDEDGRPFLRGCRLRMMGTRPIRPFSRLTGLPPARPHA